MLKLSCSICLAFHYIMKNFMLCTSHQISLGDQIKKKEMGGACGMCEWQERFIQGFGQETWGKETTWKT
jgi:hypothetical protein